MGWLSPEQLAALGVLSQKENVVKSTTMVREGKELIKIFSRFREGEGMRPNCPRIFQRRASNHPSYQRRCELYASNIVADSRRGLLQCFPRQLRLL